MLEERLESSGRRGPNFGRMSRCSTTALQVHRRRTRACTATARGRHSAERDRAGLGLPHPLASHQSRGQGRHLLPEPLLSHLVRSRRARTTTQARPSAINTDDPASSSARRPSPLRTAGRPRVGSCRRPALPNASPWTRSSRRSASAAPRRRPRPRRPPSRTASRPSPSTRPPAWTTSRACPTSACRPRPRTAPAPSPTRPPSPSPASRTRSTMARRARARPTRSA